MTEKILSVDEYVSKLPRPDEVPSVTQEQLLRLYRDDAAGRHDEELMAEVESRLGARLELMIIITDLSHNILMAARPPEPDVVERDSNGAPSAVRMIDGNVVRIITKEDYAREAVEWERLAAGRTLGEIDAAGGIRVEGPIQSMMDALSRYDIEPTDFGRQKLVKALHALNKTKFGGAPWGKRMIAIDSIVQLAHAHGPLAENFIENSPKDIVEFLDDLSNDPAPISPMGTQYHRRPEVRVRQHQRRT